MQYSQAKQGRVFILRLEDGEILHQEIERFAAEHQIQAAFLIAVGGADRGSKLIVGPKDPEARPVPPLQHILSGIHEVAGVGTIFPDEDGNPLLHMHLACGRKDKTVTGCGREGVIVWEVLEVIITELTGTDALREFDPETGFTLLNLTPKALN